MLTMSVCRAFSDKAPFELRRPAELQVPFLFNSPHSGRCYPRAFLDMSCLDAREIRLSEDRYVDCLFDDVTVLGAAFMVADFPRAYLDVNREAFELDATMFSDSLPDFIPANPTMRVQAGLGCIPRIVAPDKPIYAEKIPVHEALGRVFSIYQPYHVQLRHKMENMKSRFGYAVLVDCHSMPGQLRYYRGEEQPDIILGDMYGRSCGRVLTRYATMLLEAQGYRVAHNQPYAGGYITAHYGRPLSGYHALQIELNRNLYLNPQSLELTAGFDVLKRNMACFAQALVAIPESSILPESREAAE